MNGARPGPLSRPLATGVSLSLPPGFSVLGPADGPGDDVAVDPGVVQAAREWLDGVRDRDPGQEVLLVALHSEQLRDEEVTGLLLVTATRMTHGVLSVEQLRLLALQRTSTSGEVSRLQLPEGGALGAVDVVLLDRGPEATPTGMGLVEVELPMHDLGLLIRFSLWTAHLDLLAAYAGIMGDVAAGVRVDRSAA